jgi:hypothetical protein
MHRWFAGLNLDEEVWDPSTFSTQNEALDKG